MKVDSPDSHNFLLFFSFNIYLGKRAEVFTWKAGHGGGCG